MRQRQPNRWLTKVVISIIFTAEAFIQALLEPLTEVNHAVSP